MKRFLDFIEWPAAAALVLLIGYSAQAQNQEEELVDVRPPAPAVERSGEAATAYWIGILGGEVSPALQSHLGLEGAGVLVREVVPNSPAAEAGLKQHDVLLTANGKAATDMGVLAAEVREVGGQEGGKIVLDLLRTGGHMQITVVPAERPATPQPVGQAAAGGQAGLPAGVQGMFGGDGFDFGGADGEGGPFRFRLFGPGVTVKGDQGNVVGNTTSVRVSTINGQTHVTVTHNGQTWEVDAGDPEALEKLPPELRPAVEGLLKNPGAGVDMNIDLGGGMPNLQGLQGLFDAWGERRAERIDARMLRQMERMERQMEELRRRLEGQGMEEPGIQAPLEENNLAPAFEPPAQPAEIELPIEEE